jgi:hypothetical protein
LSITPLNVPADAPNTTVPTLLVRLLPLASLACTVIVEVEEPLAVIEDGLAVIVVAAALTGPGLKVTVGFVLSVIESVVSVAVKVSTPVIVDFTVNVTTPSAELDPDAGLIVAAPVCARVTVFPETGLPCASKRVTVIVDVATPSAAKEVGNAETVDCAAETGPAVNVTTALSVILLPPIVPVMMAEPTTVGEVRIAVYVPSPLSVTALSAPEVVDNVTVPPLATKLLLAASFACTVIVEVEAPSAVIEAGLGVIVVFPALTGPTATTRTVAVKRVESLCVSPLAPQLPDNCWTLPKNNSVAVEVLLIRFSLPLLIVSVSLIVFAALNVVTMFAAFAIMIPPPAFHTEGNSIPVVSLVVQAYSKLAPLL